MDYLLNMKPDSSMRLGKSVRTGTLCLKVGIPAHYSVVSHERIKSPGYQRTYDF